MSQIIEVVIGGTPFDVYLYDANTMEAAEKAAAAAASAANAEAFSGPTYANQAAGEAATTNGQYFAVNASGIVSIYLRTGGGSTLQRVMLTTAAAAATGGAALVGKSGGGTVQDGLDDLDATVALDKGRDARERTLLSHISAKLPDLKIWDVVGYGPGGVQHNFQAIPFFRSIHAANMGGANDTITAKYVSWATGNDSNNGRGSTPYKTLKKALQVAENDVFIIGDSFEVLDIEGTDNLVSSLNRPIIVRSLGGNFSFRAEGMQPADVTWTEYGGTGVTGTFSFTNSAGKRAEQIYYAPDGDLKNGVLIPFNGIGSGAADTYTKAAATLNGWSQDGASGDIYLRFWGAMDINANKAKFVIVYAGPAHKLKGAKVLFENVGFVGGGGFETPDSTANSAFKAEGWFKNCEFFGSSVAGVTPNGQGFAAFQNCFIGHHSGDGVAPYGEAIVVAFDCVMIYNGSPITYGGVTNAFRNRQDFSTHEESRCMLVACLADLSYGQLIANTTDDDDTITTHLIGCHLPTPWDGDAVGSNILSPTTALETHGVAFVDTCLIGGPLADTAWVVAAGGRGFSYRNQLYGTAQPSSAGIDPYDPYAASLEALI